VKVRRFLENACLLGAAILIWSAIVGSIVGGVWLGVATAQGGGGDGDHCYQLNGYTTCDPPTP
jgi:hypothetical protein